MGLLQVNDSTSMSGRKVYQIEGYLYRYSHSDPYAKIYSPQYIFRPLAGQRRHADLRVNRSQLMSKVWEVEGMEVTPHAVANKVAVQLSLF